MSDRRGASARTRAPENAAGGRLPKVEVVLMWAWALVCMGLML